MTTGRINQITIRGNSNHRPKQPSSFEQTPTTPIGYACLAQTLVPKHSRAAREDSRERTQHAHQRSKRQPRAAKRQASKCSLTVHFPTTGELGYAYMVTLPPQECFGKKTPENCRRRASHPQSHRHQSFSTCRPTTC